MWSCVRKQKRLSAYLDGELNGPDTEAVGAHVTDCPACREKLENLRRLAPAMHSLKVPPVPAGLANQVMAQARAKTTTSRHPYMLNPLDWWQIVSTPLKFSAYATLILAFLLGLMIGRVDFFSANQQTIAARPASLEGFEWFSQTPPASLGSTYIVLASNDVEGINR